MTLTGLSADITLIITDNAFANLSSSLIDENLYLGGSFASIKS